MVQCGIDHMARGGGGRGLSSGSAQVLKYPTKHALRAHRASAINHAMGCAAANTQQSCRVGAPRSTKRAALRTLIIVSRPLTPSGSPAELDPSPKAFRCIFLSFLLPVVCLREPVHALVVLVLWRSRCFKNSFS